MCDDAIIETKRGRITASTQQELADALGLSVGELAINSDYYPDARSPELCLCPVDMDKTAARSGWNMQKMKYDDHWFGEFYFTRLNKQQNPA